MKISLNDVKDKIDINDYSFKEYAEYFLTFEGKFLYIQLHDKLIKMQISKSQLPHLIGLHYAFTKKTKQIELKGENGFNILIENKITAEEFEKRIRKNKVYANGKLITWDMIKARIEWLPFFLNTMTEKTRMALNSNEHGCVATKMRGDYFYYKMNNSLYLIISIIKGGKKYYPESFIVYDDANFLLGLPEIEIIDIYWKTQKSYR